MTDFIKNRRAYIPPGVVECLFNLWAPLADIGPVLAQGCIHWMHTCRRSFEHHILANWFPTAVAVLPSVLYTSLIGISVPDRRGEGVHSQYQDSLSRVDFAEFSIYLPFFTCMPQNSLKNWVDFGVLQKFSFSQKIYHGTGQK